MPSQVIPVVINITYWGVNPVNEVLASLEEVAFAERARISSKMDKLDPRATKYLCKEPWGSIWPQTLRFSSRKKILMRKTLQFLSHVFPD